MFRCLYMQPVELADVELNGTSGHRDDFKQDSDILHLDRRSHMAHILPLT